VVLEELVVVGFVEAAAFVTLGEPIPPADWLPAGFCAQVAMDAYILLLMAALRLSAV
jgi:hypothetical protein